jgi:hypothetical protein
MSAVQDRDRVGTILLECAVRKNLISNLLMPIALAVGLLTACGENNDGDGQCSTREPDQHRAESVPCADTPRLGGGRLEADAGGTGSCSTNSDCTDGANGVCSMVGREQWECTYDRCFSDEDCGDSVCACDGGWRTGANVCLGGDCQTDADCGDGGFCSPSLSDCGDFGGVVGWYCHNCEDECVNDSDCGPDPRGSGLSGYCLFSPTEGHWVCGYGQCAG